MFLVGLLLLYFFPDFGLQLLIDLIELSIGHRLHNIFVVFIFHLLNSNTPKILL